MIADLFIWLLGTVVQLVAWLIDLIPLPDPDPILSGISGGIGSVFAAAGALSFWVPFGAAGAAVLLVAAVAGVSFGVKVVRIVASFLTLGGGSAA